MVEAVFYIGIAPFLACWALWRHPYCEHCGCLLEWSRNVHRLQASRSSAALEKIPAGDFSVFQEPRNPAKGDPFTLQFDVFRCPLCRDRWFLSVIRDGAVLLRRLPVAPEDVAKVWPLHPTRPK